MSSENPVELGKAMLMAQMADAGDAFFVRQVAGQLFSRYAPIYMDYTDAADEARLNAFVADAADACIRNARILLKQLQAAENRR